MTLFLQIKLYNVVKAGEKMVVYADILIIVNFIVDYFLLLLSAKFLQKKVRLWRLIVAAAVGGFFSLYIFLPQTNFLCQIAIQLLMCMVLCFITFGFEGIKNFLRSVAVLFAVNFAYSGAMIAVWIVFKPYGMVINNSVVYFNISPIFLILFSVLGYFAVMVLRKLLKKSFSQNAYCFVTVHCDNRTIKLDGIVDSGNSLEDVFGISVIFITDKKVVSNVLGDEIQNPARFRKIPCNTVAGERLLDGYRIDKAQVVYENKKYDFKNPILAVSVTPLEDCKIIVNPENLV